MLNMEEINNTIEELENSSTTFDNCMKLASLYIVRDEHQKTVTDDGKQVESELNDILPQYQIYCNIKRKYQLQELPDTTVQIAMKAVCKEIEEFMHTLYSSTDMPEERELIRNLIHNLQEAF